MTGRGKFVITIVILAVVGFGIYRWWDQIAPTGRPTNQSVNPQEVKKALDAAKAATAPAGQPAAASAADVAKQLLAGDKAVGTALPVGTGGSGQGARHTGWGRPRAASGTRDGTG